MSKIPIYRPYLHGNERAYVNACLDSTWISSRGEFIERFEKGFSHYIDAPFASTVCNGTVALHLALAALGIGPSDEVIVPSLTYVASVNAIHYTGAVPVFADSLQQTWQLDPEDVKRKITPRTKAILAVHLYGHPCEMNALKAIADQHGLFLIEDCAEAFGSYYYGKHVGHLADVATFSFFGNKTLTTGEGGMVIAHDPVLCQKIAILKNQGNSLSRTYWHDVVGYNYRMTNLAAAIGLAQLEQASIILEKKRSIAQAYLTQLAGLPLDFQVELPHCHNSHWMVSLLVQDPLQRDPLRKYLAECGIETRPFFHPIHQLPMYNTLESGRSCPVAEDLSSRGLNLPSFPDLLEEELTFICKQIHTFFDRELLLCSAAADMRAALPISS